MNGPAHWRLAEAHLVRAAKIETDGDQDSMSAWHQRQAQVHMTAALTAAVITTGAHNLDAATRHEWLTATDPEYAAEQAAEVTR